jgi:type VI protein secretion system component VasF
MADDFFARFNQTMVDKTAVDQTEAGLVEAAAASGSRIPVWAWAVGAIVILLLALFLAKSTGGQ